jgi:hypothetical protein
VELERNPDGTPKGCPCCDRVFPDPDPLFRFIDPIEGPGAFWRLPRDERSRRLRAYLIAIAAGEDPLLGWMLAMDFTPDTIRDLHQLIDVENRDDERIEGLIADGATLDPSKRLIRFVLDG